MSKAWLSDVCITLAVLSTSFTAHANPIIFLPGDYDNTANTVTAGPTFVDNQTTGDFRDIMYWKINNGSPAVGSADYINQGTSLGTCNGGLTACPGGVGSSGNTALNFTGPAVTGGQRYLTVYDLTPADTSSQNTVDASAGHTISTDVLFSPGQHSTWGGLVAMYGEGQDGLAFLLHNGGGNNADGASLGPVGANTALLTDFGGGAVASLSSGTVVGLDWYRLILTWSVVGDTFTVTGQVWSHSSVTDPNSALAVLLATVTATGSVSANNFRGVGEVGLMSYANGITGNGCPPPYTSCTDNVGTSVTNFDPSLVPEPGTFVIMGSGAALIGGGLRRRSKKRNRS